VLAGTYPVQVRNLWTKHTLLNAVLVGGLGGAGDTLNALVVVVLSRGALLGVPALYNDNGC